MRQVGQVAQETVKRTAQHFHRNRAELVRTWRVLTGEPMHGLEACTETAHSIQQPNNVIAHERGRKKSLADESERASERASGRTRLTAMTVEHRLQLAPIPQLACWRRSPSQHVQCLHVAISFPDRC